MPGDRPGRSEVPVAEPSGDCTPGPNALSVHGVFDRFRTSRSSIGSAMLARFSNRVMFFRKVSLTVPVAPLRFLARSARRCRAGRSGRSTRGGGAARRGRRPARWRPDSRRSAIRGRRSSRFSTARLSCERAIDRHLELARERLEPPADLGDLLLPAVARLVAVDQLDVIDHDQAEVLRGSLSRRALAVIWSMFRAGVSSMNSGDVAQLVVALAQQRDLAGAQVLAGPELVAVDPRAGAEQPLGQLEPAHFQADEEHGGFLSSTAAWSQMFSASAVLPMLGRAARMMSCSGWKPAGDVVEVEDSRSRPR